jgi:colanic acid/amylovoran biosynthesis glycosyltransferase
MAKTIAYLTSQYPAPSHTFIRREIDALRRRGLQIHTFSVRRPLPQEILSERDRQDVADTFYVLPALPVRTVAALARTFLRDPMRFLSTLWATAQHRLPGLKNLVWALFYFIEGMMVADELRRRGIDHLHNHFANASASVGFAATRYLGIDWSLTLHGISDFDYPHGPLLPGKIAHARFLACVSHFGRAQAMRVSDPVYWSKLFIARCGVDLAGLPPKGPSRQDRLRLIQVARLSPEKGQIGLLEAFAAAVKRGLDAELLIVGDGPDQERVATRIAALGMGDRVTLPGRVSEAHALSLIASADIFVLSSFMEGLPVVLMEALALGVPVIAPSIAGVPELVEPHVSGMTFPAGDWNELTDRILKLAGDPSLRARLAAEGKSRVEAEFAVNRAVEPMYSAFTRS